MSAASFRDHLLVDEKKSELLHILRESFADSGEEHVPDNLKFLLANSVGPADNLQCAQIGVEDGYINYLYRVGEVGRGEDEKPFQSVVVKLARRTFRCVEAEGVQFKAEDEGCVGALLSVERNGRECRMSRWLGDAVPGSTPDVYWLDTARHFFVMEDLSGHVTLRNMLLRGVIERTVFVKMARLLATLHRLTHVNTLTPERRVDLFHSFHNPVLSTVERVNFDMAFRREMKISVLKPRKLSASIEKLYPEIMDNEAILRVLSLLKAEYRNGVCIIHNDTHPGSFLVKCSADMGSGCDVRVIDMECGGVGSYIKEVGYTLGELVMFHHVYEAWGRRDKCGDILAAVAAFIEEYTSIMAHIIDDPVRFHQYVAAYIGQFIGMLLVGYFTPFKPLHEFEQHESECLQTGIRLMKNMERVTDMHMLIQMVRGR